MQHHLEILTRARAEGIAAAYAPMKQSPFEQLAQLCEVLDQTQEPQTIQALIAMWLMVGDRALRREEISHDDLSRFIAAGEASVLSKAEASGETALLDGCKLLLAWAYNTLNVQHSNQKDYHQALAAVSRAIEYQPQAAMYYRNRAGTHMDLNDFASALPDLQRAQELEPDAQRLPGLWQTYHEGAAKRDASD